MYLLLKILIGFLNWLIKKRSLYCIDALLKTKKYFVFIKANSNILDSLDID